MWINLVIVRLVGSSLLGACSLIYNPNNLPPEPAEAGPPDAQQSDAEIILDANPEALALESVEPSVLVEGQGTGGSYSTILVIHGTQIVKNDTTVSITAHDGTGPIAGITVDNSKLDVSANGRDLAVPVTFAVDLTKGKLAPRVRLDVTVSQMGMTGLVTATLATKPADVAVLELVYLDELTNASPEFMAGQVAPGTYRYSKVDITGGLRPLTTVGPLRVEAISSITITGVTDFKATLGAPGAGGNRGGDGGGASTLGPAIPGGTGFGPGGGMSSGGGGGFGEVGLGGGGGPTSGDVGVKDLALNRSSGGGGGQGGTGLAAPGGGVGGAGGGVIELVAGGDLMIGDLTAIGGDGTPIAAAANGGGGGGGSGGTILLRARRVMTMTSATAAGGLAGGGGSVASSSGGSGRVRIDVPTVELTVNSTPPSYRGPMMVADTNLIVRTPTPTFAVVGAKNKSFGYYFTNSEGATAGPATLIGPTGMQNLAVRADKPLGRGINHFCLLVDGADPSSPPEAMNCFEIVYLYTP